MKQHKRLNLRVITRALLARFLFVGHSVLAIWQLVDVSGKPSFWALTAISCSILAEGMLIILSRQGQEAKWFCTSVFLYLCSIVPAVWYLQLNLTVWPHVDPKKTYLESALQVSRELWVQIISQTILVTLIIGRWMLPKGEITREQLSQILLAYLAISSDIVEMFDTFKEPIIRQAPKVQYAVLTVWTLSLAQFPFVMTTSRARKMRVAITQSSSDEEIKRLQYMASCEARDQPKWVQILGDTDVWAIILALSFQDIPFVVVRLYLMVEYRLMSYTMIFFTCKNALVFTLQLYRFIVILQERYSRTKVEQNFHRKTFPRQSITPTHHSLYLDAHRLFQHYRAMLDACKDVLYRFRDEGMENFRGKGRKKRAPKSSTRDHPTPNAVASSSNIGKRHHRNERGKRSSAASKMLVDETEDPMISSATNAGAQLQHQHRHRQRRDGVAAKPSTVTPVGVKRAAKSTSFQEADEIIRIDFFREGETKEDDDSNEISFASKHSVKRSDDFSKLEYHSDDDRRSPAAEHRRHRRTNREPSDDSYINDERRSDDGRRQSKRQSLGKKDVADIGSGKSKARLADAENSQIEINLA